MANVRWRETRIAHLENQRNHAEHGEICAAEHCAKLIEKLYLHVRQLNIFSARSSRPASFALLAVVYRR